MPVIKMRVSSNTKKAWIRWTTQVLSESDLDKVSYEYALDEALRKLGMLPQKVKVY